MLTSRLDPIPASSAARPSWRDGVPCLLGGLIGLIAFASSLGLEVVDPRAYTWLLRDDWSIHFLGWHLFRAGPWELPLGATPLLRAPVGSSVGLTDSIPALAALFKLAEPLLPVRAQYIGLWLLCCFVLQGVFGVLLMRLVSSRRSLQLVGAALLVLSPPLLFRIRHPALTAHWLLLAALWLYFGAASGKPTTKLLAWWALVTGVAAATHPYNTLMVFAFTMAAYARQVVAAPSSAPRILAHVVTLLACAGLLLWQSGYFAVGQTRDLDVKGLGFLSMNLLAPIIPLDGSTLLGPGPANLASPWQFEGYAYLGAGVLLLGVVAVSRLLWSARHLTWARTAWHHVPFAIACVALTTLAVSPTVTFGARTLFEYDGRWWGPFSVFRASGRLFWPVFYAISFGILAGVARMRYRWALTFLTIAVAVQAFDVSGSYRAARQYRALGFDNPLQSHFWTVAPKHYKHLVLVPSNLCDWEGIFDHTPFALLAGDYGLSINAGGTARFDTQRVEQYCAQMRRNLRSRAMSPDAMYVLRPGLVAPFQAGANPRVVCTPVDGFGVCVVSETYLHWQDGYDVVRLALPPTSDFIGFYHELDQYYRERLQRPPFATHGSREERLGALVKYLAYRLAGCDHDESERKTLGEVRRDRELRLCADSVPTTALPPPDDTLRFRQRLEAVYRDELSKATETTSVDAEGEAVWVQQYARDRLAGKSDREARQGVLQTIDAIAGR